MAKHHFDKVKERLDLAEKHIEMGDVYFYLKDAEGLRGLEEPTEFEGTQIYHKDIQDYFRFTIDYFTQYDSKATSVLPWNWIYFSDINDDMIERKFPRDRDLRAYISAFRITIIRNQKLNIWKKRHRQFWASAVALLPVAALCFLPGSVDGLLAAAAVPAGLEGPVVAGASLAVAVLSFLGLRYFLENTTNQLRARFQSNAKDLSSKIQNRLNMLSKNQQHFQRKVTESQFDTDDIENGEWTHRAKWWFKICMWMPKRIEYIEKFLQSEMQRLRMARRRIIWWGNGWASLIAVAMIAGGGIMAWRAVGEGAPMSQVAWAFGVGALAALLFARTSMRDRYAITNAYIKRWIGENEWQRFSAMALDEELSELVRRDKEALRQEKLKGGYGSGGGSGKKVQAPPSEPAAKPRVDLSDVA